MVNHSVEWDRRKANRLAVKAPRLVVAKSLMCMAIIVDNFFRPVKCRYAVVRDQVYQTQGTHLTALKSVLLCGIGRASFS